MSLTVSRKTLLLIHIIIPVLFGVLFADIYILDGVLHPYLQFTATTFAVYLLFFDLPHILASFVSYADREYLKHYRRRLLFVPVLVAAGIALYFYNFYLLFVLYALYTMWHVIRQQTGVTGMLLKRFSVAHRLWSYIAIVSYTYAFLLIDGSAVEGAFAGLLQLKYLYVLVAMFVLVCVLYAWQLRAAAADGFAYFVLTSLVVLSGAVFIWFGYPFLAILVVRFVHDITAFVFYAIHDTNRNQDTARNSIYAVLRPLGLPLIVITPLLAILAAAAVRYGLEPLGIVSLVIMLLGIIHYYLEGFMWKRDSLHRQYIQVGE